jgi:homoserine kinase type II
MSVFTTVSFEQLQQWLTAYPLGELLELKGIAAGITNTNYFVTTSTGRFVLTIFEEHAADELPYYLDLMSHLADNGVPCPHPVANLNGDTLGELNEKPAALVTCLVGRDLTSPTLAQCAEVGHILAKMHLAGASFKGHGRNTRDAAWRHETADKVLSKLSAEEQQLLVAMLNFQENFNTQALPQGLIHADLFRDNVLFDGDKVGGLIDFYYACHDTLLYDIAITVNDWCTAEDGTLDEASAQALLQAYHQLRPFNAAENTAWSGMLQIAALRFWLSRLNDYYFPQAGELTHAKDPRYFEQILKMHQKYPQTLSAMHIYTTH